MQGTEILEKAFSTDTYRQIFFDRAPVGILIVAPDGTILQVNNKICHVLQYSRGELLGLRYQEITHPFDVQADDRNVDMTASGDQSSYVMRKRYRRKDGHYIWAELAVHRYPEDGAVEHFVSFVSEDIPLTGLKETVEDGQAKLRPSITAWQFVKDNPGAIVGLVALFLILTFISGNGGAVIQALQHLVKP